MQQLKRLVDIYVALAPMLKALVAENAASGIPVQRPLFLYHENDPRCLNEQFEYLLGSDVLVAPVWHAEAETRDVYLPEGNWIHLWSGNACSGGDVTIDAPLGYPPVFYLADSPWASLMEQIRSRFA